MKTPALNFLLLAVASLLTTTDSVVAVTLCPPSVQLESKIGISDLNSVEVSREGASFIQKTQFKEKRFPTQALQTALEEILLLHPLANLPRYSVFFGEAAADYELKVFFTPDDELFAEIHLKDGDAKSKKYKAGETLGSASLKQVNLGFKMKGGVWTEIAVIRPLPDALKSEKGRKRWETEIQVSTQIRALQKSETEISKDALDFHAPASEFPKSYGLARIHWVAPDAIYQDRYENSLFEFFNSSRWTKFSTVERMQVMRAAAIGLIHFQNLNGQRISHRDLKPDNFLFRFKNLLQEEECLEVVVTDFDLALDLPSLLADNLALPGAGTPEYVDPSLIFVASSMDDSWVQRKSKAIPNYRSYMIPEYHWLGDTIDDRIRNAQLSDVYSWGIVASLALFGMQDSFWIRALDDENEIEDRARMIQSRMQEIHESPVVYNGLTELLRLTLESDARNRISIDAVEKALRIWTKPIAPTPAMSAPVRILSQGKCDFFEPRKNELQVGDYLVCEKSKDVQSEFWLLYRITDSGEKPRFVFKPLPQDATAGLLVLEFEFLSQLGVLKKRFSFK